MRSASSTKVCVLDACCILNLYASGEMGPILRALPFQFAVCPRACGEAKWLKPDERGVRDEVELQTFVEQGILLQLQLSGEVEESLYSELTASLEQGESEAAALAIERRYLLATDEGKVHRILGAKYPSLQILTTAELMHQWHVRSHSSDETCARLLQRIALRATFSPPRRDRRRKWWLGLVGE